MGFGFIILDKVISIKTEYCSLINHFLLLVGGLRAIAMKVWVGLELVHLLYKLSAVLRYKLNSCIFQLLSIVEISQHQALQAGVHVHGQAEHFLIDEHTDYKQKKINIKKFTSQISLSSDK
jgi:hypothetical protein